MSPEQPFYVWEPRATALFRENEEVSGEGAKAKNETICDKVNRRQREGELKGEERVVNAQWVMVRAE